MMRYDGGAMRASVTVRCFAGMMRAPLINLPSADRAECVVAQQSLTRSHSALHSRVDEHIVANTNTMGKRMSSSTGSCPVNCKIQALAVVRLSQATARALSE